ncbi:uncharacterized protein LACBIDRAFT_298547 [Laccaria bicolor S238N-H82]|uniref:Predicted protein n=1 Tax=Laccaria bicolor (strain S238N-H82 / ATCC MYA-4686) TaxID=486041 RepID=B0DD32_LACBS|nr:uncharacterized protein LACBIDRAFT_298547 [Laccaria bicolor S238N-H82]EDR07400.1 predicted protein [Laccaria bicolor S238N-H82]|eukprot:XP_001881792.1 predicted protein [Laccaria bicolor S238N-H82]
MRTGRSRRFERSTRDRRSQGSPFYRLWPRDTGFNLPGPASQLEGPDSRTTG